MIIIIILSCLHEDDSVNMDSWPLAHCQNFSRHNKRRDWTENPQVVTDLWETWNHAGIVERTMVPSVSAASSSVVMTLWRKWHGWRWDVRFWLALHGGIQVWVCLLEPADNEVRVSSAIAPTPNGTILVLFHIFTGYRAL